ncbi:Protein of unknown function [Pyronema omphalodes CBS 100304]|jgi:hypothetical protein
MQT